MEENPDQTRFRREYVRVRGEIAAALRHSDPLHLATGRETRAYELEASNLMPYFIFGTDPPTIAWTLYAELYYWYGVLPFAASDLLAVSTRIDRTLQRFQTLRQRFDGSDILPQVMKWPSDDHHFSNGFSEICRFIDNLRKRDMAFELSAGRDAVVTVTIYMVEGTWEIGFLSTAQARVSFMKRSTGQRIGSKLWLKWFTGAKKANDSGDGSEELGSDDDLSVSKDTAAMMQRRYEDMRRRVVEALQAADPMSIVQHQEHDSYVIEGDSIASRLRFGDDYQGTKLTVCSELKYWHDLADCDDVRLVTAIGPIYRAWQVYQQARDVMGAPGGLPRYMDWHDKERRLERPFHDLNIFIDGLAEHDVRFALQRWAPTAVSVLVEAAEGHWELDFFEDGTLEVELLTRYGGPTTGSSEWLERLLSEIDPDTSLDDSPARA
jgi:hypothetical protein